MLHRGESVENCVMFTRLEFIKGVRHTMAFLSISFYGV